MRIYYPFEEQTEAVHIRGEKAHYLADVLRCKPSDEIVIFDGKGKSRKAVIKSITKKEVVVEIIESIVENTESPLHITLLQGLLKGEKMDLVIQKTTELGIKEIIPVITERSQVRDTKKVERWRKIAEDAARQSGRNVIPAVREPIELSAWLAARSLSSVNGIIFWEESEAPLKEVLTRISPHGHTVQLLTGPEGGFRQEEVKMAENCGFMAASLGKRILRAETAAITAIAIIQFQFGDLG